MAYLHEQVNLGCHTTEQIESLRTVVACFVWLSWFCWVVRGAVHSITKRLLHFVCGQDVKDIWSATVA